MLILHNLWNLSFMHLCKNVGLAELLAEAQFLEHGHRAAWGKGRWGQVLKTILSQNYWSGCGS